MGEPAAREALEAAGLDAGQPLAPAGAGARNEVWLGHDMVVRLLASPERAAMEAAVLARVASTAGAAGAIPVAEVVWWSPAAMVQARLPGRRLAEVAAPSLSLRDDVVAVLDAIHRVPIGGGFGNLTASLRGEDDRLSDWFVGRVRDEARPDDLAALEAAVPLLDRQPSGLVHGDFQPTNLLVEGDRVTGVLDWEAAKAGPPAFDLGWWDWWSATFGTPWPLSEPEDEDEAALRSLVARRVELRERARRGA